MAYNHQNGLTYHTILIDTFDFAKSKSYNKFQRGIRYICSPLLEKQPSCLESTLMGGVWHGALFWFSLIGKVSGADNCMYAHENSGVFYFGGYVLGLIVGTIIIMVLIIFIWHSIQNRIERYKKDKAKHHKKANPK